MLVKNYSILRVLFRWDPIHGSPWRKAKRLLPKPRDLVRDVAQLVVY